jgi:surfactin synthase thioesterase subunit
LESQWIDIYCSRKDGEEEPLNQIKLLCFPYAGGSALTYLSWKRYFPDHIKICPVELAGRGKRIGEPFYGSVDEAIDDLFLQVQSTINDIPYALFGHSMGTILTYEFVRRLRKAQLREPLHAFFSGRFPPSIGLDTENHRLPDEKFIGCIRQFGIMGEEVLNNQELMSIVLPIIRADYRMVELYKHIDEGFRLDCPITVFSGKTDSSVKWDDLQMWKECTTKTCTFHEFDGGHFFIHEWKASIAQLIVETFPK